MPSLPAHRNSTSSKGSPTSHHAAGGVRILIRDFVASERFEAFMVFVIICHVVMMVVETDAGAECVTERRDLSECQHTWIVAVNVVMLSTYTIESVLRLCGEQLDFCRNFWNLLDTVVLVGGWSDFAMVMASSNMPGPSASLLRMFRVGRLVRILRVVSVFPELYELVRGFFAAVMAMFWGFIMILVFLVVFSIVGVEIFHPINVTLHHEDEYCEDIFASVWNATLMFIQTLVAGDSWGLCTIPIIQHNNLSIVFFASAVITIQLGVTNLILSVVVQRAEAAHLSDVQQVLERKELAQKMAAETLRADLAAIDDNKNGRISVAELRDGFDTNMSIQERLRSLDMKKEELDRFLSLLDASNDGEVLYDDLVDAIVATTEGDSRKQVMMLRLESAEIARMLQKHKIDMEEIYNSISRIRCGVEVSKPGFQSSAVLEEPHPLGDPLEESGKELHRLGCTLEKTGKEFFEALHKLRDTLEKTGEDDRTSLIPSINTFRKCLPSKIKQLKQNMLQSIDSWEVAMLQGMCEGSDWIRLPCRL